LELALAGTPMVVGYKVDAMAGRVLRRLITAPSAVLVNLVLGERAIPELLQEHCTPVELAAAGASILEAGPPRARQLQALARVPQRMAVQKGSPSEAAADIVLDYAERGRGWPRGELASDA